MNVQEDENVCFSSIVVIFHPLTAQRDFSIHSFIFICEFCFFIAISSMSRMMTTMVYGKCRVYKKILEKFVQCNQSDGCDEIKRGWKITDGKSLRGMNKKYFLGKFQRGSCLVTKNIFAVKIL